MLELLGPLVVCAAAEVDDVGDTQGSELFHVAPSLDRAAERQPVIYKERLHSSCREPQGRFNPLPSLRLQGQFL